jgi:hypothetical protein
VTDELEPLIRDSLRDTKTRIGPVDTCFQRRTMPHVQRILKWWCVVTKRVWRCVMCVKLL